MKLLFTPEALSSYNEIKAAVPREAEQAKDVIKDILAHPETGKGTPTPLSGALSGLWSREYGLYRQIIYQILPDEIKIYAVGKNSLPIEDSAVTRMTKESSLAMKTTTYRPNPFDTSEVVLSDDLLQLAEQMARNVHEVWAANRLSQGWTLGPERNDDKKTTPCLVPYEMLSEEERQYDRDTSMETLKFIIGHGFEIRKTRV